MYNTGIVSANYSGSLCNEKKCIPTVDNQIFFCYDLFLRKIVPCNNSTWDPVTGFCGIVTVKDTGCTAKKCVDNTRLDFLGAQSVIWECVNPRGQAKMCGFFESNVDKLYYLGLSANTLETDDDFGVSLTEECIQAYKNWDKKPESLVFDLF